MKKKILMKLSIIPLLVILGGVMMGTFAIAENKSSSTVNKQGVESSININEATIKDLSSLEGIGKKKAEAIIAYRTDHGKFSSVDDLRKVEGIGKKTLIKIKDRIVIE